jgi:predicted nucleotidyltransferase
MIDEIERWLEEITLILKANIIELKEIRVFGSYENGFWNPEKSDIDIFVLTSYENYSNLDKAILLHNSFSILRKKTDVNLTNEYTKRFGFHIVSKKELERLVGKNTGRGDIGRSMLNGRLLYSNS